MYDYGGAVVSDFFTEDDIARTYGMGRLEKYDFLNGLILERSKVVYGAQAHGLNSWCTKEEKQIDTHQARLIMIEPIKKDSAESLLSEIVKYDSQIKITGIDIYEWRALLERASKLLNKQGAK
jgi:hypothetical protein